LRDLIAKREEVAPECVVLGGGSTEIFSLASLCYVRPGTEVLVAEPTYAGFIGYTQSLGANIVSIPLTERWEADLDAMAKRVNKNTSLVYICNPNNPTGTITDGPRLRDFCRELTLKCPVIVDEAYIELVEDSKRASMVEFARRGAPVIVVRTFSKIYGLAGLRIGYGIARADITSDLRRRQTTFCPVNRLGIVAARAAYLDVENVSVSRRRIAEARATLYPVLEKLGHKAIPGSQANFIAFEAKGGSPQLVARLRSDFNIGVRSYEFLGKSWVRVSMGTKEEMDSLIPALKEIG
jgi:histidinol-phosphate aminotransferase